MYTGPHTVKEGLILGYDVGAGSYFYPGEPTTNTLTWSQDFSVSPWINRDLVVGTGYLAPDGTYTAQLASNPSKDKMIYRSSGTATGQHKSVHARTVSGTGTVAIAGFWEISQYIVELTPEWQRFDFPANSGETGGTNFYIVDFRGGDLTECLIWGAQNEVKDHVTPYIKSEGSQGVRGDTEALRDMAGKTTFDVSNMAFDSDAKMYYANNEYMDLPNDPGYTTEVSAFAMFKSIGTPDGGYHIICGGSQLEISIPTAGALRCGVDTGSRYVANYGSGLNGGNWHYVGLTFKNERVYAYIDGEHVGDHAAPGTLTYSFAYRRNGTFGSNTNYHVNGYVDVYHMYNRALTEDEIKRNFRAYKQRFGI
jgi:hypothetical protein